MKSSHELLLLNCYCIHNTYLSAVLSCSNVGTMNARTDIAGTQFL